ncbi:unnamed protein product [Alternaria alternata]
MAISAAGRHSIPAKAFFEQSEANGAGDMTRFMEALDRDIPFYEIPPDLPRMNRNTRIPLPRQLVLSSATIIIVPRNLLHQWQSEIQKHVLQGGLKILVVDSVPKRSSKTKIFQQPNETMEFRSELPAPTELMKFDVVLFTRTASNRRYRTAKTNLDDVWSRVSLVVYESPLKKIHWLRIIIDEGHSFSSSVSNAVLVAKQIQAERRWVVSGTPAKDLVGVEVDMSTVDVESDHALQRKLAIDQRKSRSCRELAKEAQEAFALVYPAKPIMIGATQLIEGQLYVDSSIRSLDPAAGLEAVGYAAKAKAIAMAEEESKAKGSSEGMVDGAPLQRTGVPTSLVQPLTSRRASTITSKASPPKPTGAKPVNGIKDHTDSASPIRSKKRKLTFDDETAELAKDSSLRNTRIVGTTSAKLTYLLDKVMKHQAEDKIIIFYDGDNAAFYIAQCLESMYVNHRIYARTLNNTLRSEYVRLFNEDPDVRVLLIDVACGALGLNLNAASVVLIVNPINRPNIEAQAIKRAHRIGQTKEVLVETLVLENTIEHAIFNRAKKMSRADHQEVKELEDDAGIVEIIQNAQILSVGDDEGEGVSSFALLQTPQQVFGCPEPAQVPSVWSCREEDRKCTAEEGKDFQGCKKRQVE